MITLSITNYNRSELVMDSFSKVLTDDRIDEIVIVDDFSSIDIYNDLKNRIDNLKNPKIKLYRNEQNLKLFKNKTESIRKSTNDWVIVLDSDNIIDTDYVDIVCGLDKKDDTIYCPEQLNGINFTYKEFTSHTVDRTNIKNFVVNLHYQTLMNTGNYFLNKNTFLKAVENSDIDYRLALADSIYIGYLWLLNGNKITVVPNLQYYHRVHDDSWYINNAKDYSNNIPEILQKINEL
jgi:hypothetical protein